MARSWIIFAGPDVWRPACFSTNGLELGPDISLEGVDHKELARQVSLALQTLGHRGQPVAIGLTGRYFLTAPLAAARNGQAIDRQILEYDLEEQLPLAAEEVVADFVVGKSHSFGVALPRSSWVERITALRQEQVSILSVAPTLLWASQHLCDSLPRGERPSHLIWNHDGTLDAIEFCDGTLAGWTTIPAMPYALSQYLSVSLLQRPGPIRIGAVGLTEPVRQEMQAFPDIAWWEVHDVTLESAAATQAALVMLGRATPWIELSRPELGSIGMWRAVRPHLALVVAALVTLVAAILGVLHSRAMAYANAADANEQRQQEVFQRVFAGQSVPLGIRSRLASEVARLEGLRGHNGSLPRRDTADQLLERFLAAVPQGVRWRILELRIEQGRIQIEGEIGSHGEAERITVALKKCGLSPSLPRTQQLADRRVALSLTANLEREEKNDRKADSH